MKIVLPKTDISPAIDIEKALNKNMMVVSIYEGKASILFSCGWPYRIGQDDIVHGFTKFNYNNYGLSGMSINKDELVKRVDNGDFTGDGQKLYAFSTLKEFCEEALKQKWEF